MRHQSALVLSFKQHFVERWPEWFMAGMATVWGIYIALHPEVFLHKGTMAALSGLAQMAGDYPPAALWGLCAVILGLVRASALFINGAFSRTPLIRLVMSFISALLWTQICIGFLKSGVPNIDIVVYAGLVVMDIVSAYRAATDTVFAEKVRHDLKQDRRRGNTIIA